MSGGTNGLGFSKIWLNIPACGDVVLTEASQTDVANLPSGPVTDSLSFFVDIGNYEMPQSITFPINCNGAYQTQITIWGQCSRNYANCSNNVRELFG